MKKEIEEKFSAFHKEMNEWVEADKARSYMILARDEDKQVVSAASGLPFELVQILTEASMRDEKMYDIMQTACDIAKASRTNFLITKINEENTNKNEEA